VAIVNEAFAREFFDGADPVGRILTLDDSKPDGGEAVYVVGLVRDIRHQGVREKAVPFVYTPVAQSEGTFGPTFLARSVRTPKSVIGDIRREVAAIDSSVALIEPSTLRGAIDRSLYRERMMAALGGVFGVLALLLAGIGIYGVVAYSVSQRTPEIGVRVALGATRRTVLWMVLRQGLMLMMIGIAVGLPVSLAVNRLGAALLYGIRPTDPLTITAGIGLLVGVGLIAGVIPSRRAAAIDPMQALRTD
jgi:ABC-type antimicrobial peptide transport system permease subunit